MPEAALPVEADALATPVARLGADARLQAANPAFARWLGVSARRLPGLPAAALEVDGDLEVVGTAGSLADAEALLRGRGVDVLLLDHRLPNGDRRLRSSLIFDILPRSPLDHPCHTATHDAMTVGGIHNDVRLGFKDAALDHRYQ